MPGSRRPSHICGQGHKKIDIATLTLLLWNSQNMASYNDLLTALMEHREVTDVYIEAWSLGLFTAYNYMTLNW